MDTELWFPFQGNSGNGLIVAVIKSAELPTRGIILIKYSDCEYYKSHSAA